MAETPQTNINANIKLAVRTEYNYKKYIIFTVYGDSCNDITGMSHNDVIIYKGGVYNISYYDPDKNCFITNKNVHIHSINKGYITGQFISDNCPEECLCAHREDLYNYISINVVTILLSNIYSIVDLNSKTSTDICKEVTKVSILGISTEFIRSVIVRLRIYKDDVDTEVTPIDMEVGKTYNVSYCDHKDHSMYEIEGKLTHIAIDKHFGDEPPQHGFIRPESSCENPEIIGASNNVYYTNEHFMELPKDCPEKVVFIFDTSKINHTIYDHVRLMDIRDVYEVKTEDGEGDTDDDISQIPDCDTCPYKNSSNITPPSAYPPPPPHDNCIPPFRPPVHPPIGIPIMPPPSKPIAPLTIDINDQVICTITPNYFIYKDKDGNELEKVKVEDLANIYAEDKY